jgi:HEAT repeat protein
MPEELQEQQDLMEDLLARIADPREGVRETAVEALAASTDDEDWRPDDLILCDGIGKIIDLLGDRNPHVVRSALTILTAIGSAGHEEDLLSHGVIDALEQVRDHRDPAIRKMAREALWLLTPDVEERMVPEPLDED